MKKNVLFYTFIFMIVILCVGTVGFTLMRPDIIASLLDKIGIAENEISITSVLIRVQELSAMQTIKYTYENAVTSEKQMPGILQGLYGEGMVFIAVGHVIAGIDFSLMEPGDIEVDAPSKTLILKLPHAQLMECFLNEAESYVVQRNTGIFASPAPDMEVEARRYAVKVFTKSAVERGVLKDAEEQAEEFLSALFQEVGFEEVIITFTKDVPTVTQDSSCPY